jgi:hypothetical protein
MPTSNHAAPHTPDQDRLDVLRSILPYPFGDLVKGQLDDRTLHGVFAPLLAQCSGLATACQLALATPDGQGRVDQIGDALEVLQGHLQAAKDIFDLWQEKRPMGRTGRATQDPAPDLS